MRSFLVAAIGLCLLITLSSHALDLSPDEKKLQTEFDKAYRVPDKVQRVVALSMLEGAKHPTSWQKLMGVASSDPEPEVRLAAFTVLAKEPARDPNLERMLLSLFSGIKFNDFDMRLNYVKAMAPSQFKYELVAAVADQLSKMRYPDVPKYIPQSSGPGGSSNGNAQQIKAAQKARKEFEELLEAFNAFAQSDVVAPTKESPLLLPKWFQANAAKIAAADKELADRNKKEDAEAAKAAKEAAAEAAKAAK